MSHDTGLIAIIVLNLALMVICLLAVFIPLGPSPLPGEGYDQDRRRERARRIAFAVSQIFVLVIVAFSICGLVFGKTGEPWMKFTRCWSGTEITLVFHNEAGFDIERVQWGPPEFHMTAIYVAWPGGTFGGFSNSRGICTIAEAKALGAQAQ